MQDFFKCIYFFSSSFKSYIGGIYICLIYNKLYKWGIYCEFIYKFRSTALTQLRLPLYLLLLWFFFIIDIFFTAKNKVKISSETQRQHQESPSRPQSSVNLLQLSLWYNFMRFVEHICKERKIKSVFYSRHSLFTPHSTTLLIFFFLLITTVQYFLQTFS